MKTISLLWIVSILFICGCKKEDNTPESSQESSVGYIIITPSCLLDSIVNATIPLSNYYKYDSQKRLVYHFSKQPNGATSSIHIYRYEGNKLIDTVYQGTNGSVNPTPRSIDVHYLNAMGLIDSTKTVSGMIKFRYTYNNQGYLIRELRYSEFSEVPYIIYGQSHRYENGNRISSYTLSFDVEGNIIDSTLSLSYTYDKTTPNDYEVWQTWVNRKGRANSNALLTNPGGRFTYKLNSNGFPTSIDFYDFYYERTSTSFLNWQCR
jgi:hypothetical protein